jgi:hypothetical protein
VVVDNELGLFSGVIIENRFFGVGELELERIVREE